MINLKEIAIVKTEVAVFVGKELLKVGYILENDIVVTKEDIQSLVDTEMNEGCHDDNIEDYESEIDFYLSSTKSDTYTQYIMERLDDIPIDAEVANIIGKLVEEGIKLEYDKIYDKRILHNKIDELITDIVCDYHLHEKNIEIVYQGASDGYYFLEGNTNSLEYDVIDDINFQLDSVSELVREAIKSGLIENEEDIWN